MAAVLENGKWPDAMMIPVSDNSAGTPSHPFPGGTDENSPAFQRRVCTTVGISPEGTAEAVVFSRPFGTQCRLATIPALKRRAILNHPSGMRLFR